MNSFSKRHILRCDATESDTGLSPAGRVIFRGTCDTLLI